MVFYGGFIAMRAQEPASAELHSHSQLIVVCRDLRSLQRL